MSAEVLHPTASRAGVEAIARRLGVSPLDHIIALAEQQTPEAQEEMAENLAAFWRMLRRTRTPQMCDRATSRINGRKALREAIRHGGRLTHLFYHDRIREKRLLALLDCSESAVGRGLATLACALQRVDNHVDVLGFDTQVFPLRCARVEAVFADLNSRCRDAVAAGRPFLSMAHLDAILRQAGRFSTNPQSYLLIVSELFVETETKWSPVELSRLGGALRRFRNC